MHHTMKDHLGRHGSVGRQKEGKAGPWDFLVISVGRNGQSKVGKLELSLSKFNWIVWIISGGSGISEGSLAVWFSWPGPGVQGRQLAGLVQEESDEGGSWGYGFRTGQFAYERHSHRKLVWYLKELASSGRGRRPILNQQGPQDIRT